MDNIFGWTWDPETKSLQIYAHPGGCFFLLMGISVVLSIIGAILTAK